MSTATITPLRGGGAVFELNSMTHWFPDWRTAAAEADARRLPWVLAASCDGGADARPVADEQRIRS